MVDSDGLAYTIPRTALELFAKSVVRSLDFSDLSYHNLILLEVLQRDAWTQVDHLI